MSSTFRSLIAQWASAAALASTLMVSATAVHAAPQVGVSVSVNQPGVYGRVDIGRQQPVLVYQQPIIIQPAPYSVQQRPIYMRVPPKYHKNWKHYCGQYNACNQPVYFVQNGRGYPQNYAPMHRYDDHRMKRRGERRGNDDDDRDDRRDGHRRHQHGHSHGHR